MPDISIKALVDSLREIIGIEGAEKTIYQAIDEAKVPVKSYYNEDDFAKICGSLKKKGGLISMIANFAETNAYKNVYYQSELLKEREAKEDLVRLSAALEQKVEERTRELKDAQAQSLHAAKMASIGQLSSGVAHELNNPLEGILGYTQLILSKFEKEDFGPEDMLKCKTYFSYIERESLRCKRIVDGMLDFARRSNQDFQSVDIRAIMESTITMFGTQLELKNIILKAEYGPGLPLIRGNANMLQQVFASIIINAQQAITERGSINISIRVVEEEKSNKVKIVFQDSGRGIPKESLSKIFEPFFTTKNNWKSVGLGLYICYQIIQQHSGHIFVDSEVNQGTTVTIALPAEQ